MSTGQGWFAVPYWFWPIGPVNLKMKCLLLLKNSFGFLLRDFGLLPAILAGALVYSVLVRLAHHRPVTPHVSSPRFRDFRGFLSGFKRFGQLVALSAANHGYFAVHDR